MQTHGGILLNLDDTLLDDRTATRVALSTFLLAHRLAWADESEEEALQRLRDIASVHWQRFEKGEISFHDQRRTRVRDYSMLSGNQALRSVGLEHE